MKIYQVSKAYDGRDYTIREIECVRVSKSSYWKTENSTRSSLHTNWYNSYTTIEEAKEKRARLLEQDWRHARREIERYQGYLKEIEILLAE